VSPAAPAADLRDWIVGHLDPLEEGGGAVGESDFDLSPHARPAASTPLTPASVLVGLIEREQGYSVLLTKRVDTLRRHAGQIAFPGGRRDPGETPWGAALREAHEEVGLHPDFVTLGGLSSPYQTGTGYLITPVVGFIRPGFDLVPNPDEVADIFETPFGFLMDPANHEEHERLGPDGEKRRFYAMTHEDRFIWGATAGMLRALYNRLYGAAVA
jgi:8-oxo-dGTP pyrophosphatase MutT (NUDIX family)